MSRKIKLFLLSTLLILAIISTAFGCGVVYVVSFDSNGGTAIDAVDVFSGETAEKPADPTKVGYTFAGWYLGEDEFSFETPINENITVTAKWTPNTDTPYTVKHLQEKVDGSGYEEVVSDQETLQGTTEQNTSAVAKVYQGFTAKEIEQKQIAPDGSTVVEVKYDRNLITITWVVDGVATEEGYKFGAMPSRDNPTKDADNTYTYAFNSWDSEFEAVTEEKTYTAQFDATYINYTIVFKDANGEVMLSKEDYHYGDTIVVPTEIPVKEADEVYTYEFSGWNNDATVVGNAEYTPSFNSIYVNYSVEFKNVGGATLSIKNDYHYGDSVIVPEHSENLPGYTYGWDKEIVAVNGSAVYSETKTPNTYSVNYQLNGGELEGALDSYVYGVGGTLPTAKKIGHTLEGWYASEEFSGEAVSEITATDIEDKIFYAKWTPNTYNVTLVAGAGSADATLSSYVYGVGADLPSCTRKGYTFVGWFVSEEFSGEAVSEITATDIEDKTFYAKYTANTDTKYSVQVLVAQYGWKYNSGYYYPDSDKLTYVDATAEFAEAFGLDANNKAQGTTDSVVDLTAKINALHGAKLNADSVVSGVINADETLELLVKLDVNEEDLGFTLNDICVGQYSWDESLTTFTLGYTHGTCGLVVLGKTTARAKEIIINTEPVNVTALAGYSLVIYDKGLTKDNKLIVNNIVTNDGKVYASANNEEYVKYSLNIGAQFPNEKVVNKIRLAMDQRANHSVFIVGIKAVEFKRETVTYSVANGNIEGLASTLGMGTINAQSDALHYNYTGDSVIGAHKVGVKFDLGVRASDYQSIKVKFQKTVIATNDKGEVVAQPTLQVFCDGVEIYSFYHQTATVEIDVLEEAAKKGVTLGNISTLELSVVYWANVTQCDINVKSIELVLKETLPEIEDVTYGVNLVTDGGTLQEELTSYAFGKGATLPNAQKEYHTFVGWYSSSDFSGEPVTEIGVKEFGNKTYYAKYVGNTYNVQFVTDGGTLESELTSYQHGVGATLPNAQKEGYAFVGWYLNSDFSGEPVTEISASDVEDKVFYAKYSQITYSVQVLVAQYGEGYTSGYYHIGTLSYIDATADFAEIFGLDSNNKVAAKEGQNIDLTSVASSIKGSKVNAGSILSGIVAEDSSLQLVVKLDFDEEALGFKLSDLKIGEYSCSGLIFTLKYYDGVCGLAIDGTIGNGKNIIIQTGTMAVEDYHSITLHYYENSATVETKLLALAEATGKMVHWSLFGDWFSSTEHTDYVKKSEELISRYPDLSAIAQINVQLGGGGEKHVFIAGIEKVAYKRETVTYSVANGNIENIATPLNGGVLSEEVHNFANNAEGISLNTTALAYKYNQALSGAHSAGIVFELNVKASEYTSIKITFHTVSNNVGTSAYINGTIQRTSNFYGGAHILDVKAFAEEKGVDFINTIEIAHANWSAIEYCNIYVASIELVLKA